MNDQIKSIIQASISVKQQILLDEPMLSQIRDTADATVQALKHGNRLWFCGNGGSAADAQHLAAEFTGRFYQDRKALPAEALHCNTSYLTAVANDYSFDEVYARMVEGVCIDGDILFGFSTSGNSANICNAMETANGKGVITVGFTGSTGGRLKDMCTYLFRVPSNDTPRIQEAHILLGHIICQLTEEAYFRAS
jgi:D-sedoheptulose 7-phosphate isomerase